jgi:hypothetical protein
MRAALCLIGIAALTGLAYTGVASADDSLRPAEPAGSYMVSVVTHKLDGEYAAAWQTLYPPHQKVASIDAYVSCESLVPSPGTVVAVKALRSFDEKIRIAGVRQRRSTRAVNVRVSVSSPEFPMLPVVVVQTFHAVAVKRHWRWILSTDQYAYYRAGTCPYG